MEDPGSAVERADLILRRLDRIERVLGLNPLPGAAPPVAAAPVHSGPPPARAVGMPAAGVTQAPLPGAAKMPADAPPMAPPAAPSRGAPRRRDRASGDLEKWIGGRWYAVLGALVVVIGIGLFAKLALDRGWLALPVIARCSLGAAFGVVLAGVGEWVRRRFNAWAAFGLYAAGIGSVYACTYAAYRLWAPLTASPALAFALLALVACAGIALAVHSRLAAVGVLSQITGYVTPFLFTDARPNPLVMPSYLTALLGVGLVLAAWHGGMFRVMRAVAWWATVVLGGVWVLASMQDHPVISLAFVVVVWCAVHAELVYSAGREALSAPAPRGIIRVAPGLAFLTSLSSTTWAVVLACVALYAWDRRAGGGPGIPTWASPAAWLVATGLAGMVFAGHLRVLRDAPETDRERLGAGLLVQAGACLFATVALATSGGFEVLAWMGIGAAGVVSGRWLRARAFSVYGFVALGVASVRLLAWDSWSGGLAAPEAAQFGLVFSRWMALCAAGGAAWIVLGEVSRGEKGAWARMARVAAWIGSGMLAAAFVHADASAKSVCVAWCLLALAVAGMRLLLPHLGLRWAGLAVWGAAVGCLAVAYPFMDWDRGAWSVGVHPGMLTALLLAAVGLGLAWFAPEGAERGRWLTRVGAVVTLLLFAATSLEVDRITGALAADERARLAAVSIWWGLFAIGLIAAGFWRRWAMARRAGLVLLGVASLKAVVFDLSGVSEVARVVSFIGLGLMMLAVAVVYSKVSASLATEHEPKAAGGGDDV